MSPRTARPVGEAFSQQPRDCVEVLPREIAIGVRPAAELVQLLLVPLLRRHHGDHLLGQDVQAAFGDRDAVQVAPFDLEQERGALYKLVPGQGKDLSPRSRA